MNNQQAFEKLLKNLKSIKMHNFKQAKSRSRSIDIAIL